MAISIYDPKDELSYAFMFDLLCNEHRYTPLVGHRVLDLGAHFGFFSLHCATRGAIVTAYEPDPDNFERLLNAASRAQDIGLGSIDPRRQAVWTHGGSVNLCRDHHSGTSNIINFGSVRGATRTVSFQDAVADQDWDCVKMDVEGAEFDILTSARDEDLRRIKYLSLELHNHITTRGENAQIRYERLISKLDRIFQLELQEFRDERYCKVFGTQK